VGSGVGTKCISEGAQCRGVPTSRGVNLLIAMPKNVQERIEPTQDSGRVSLPLDLCQPQLSVFPSRSVVTSIFLVAFLLVVILIRARGRNSTSLAAE
jgi:hypothetical protein